MAFGWVFATRIGTQWQQSGLTVLRRPDVRPTFVGDEVGALPLEQDAQQDDLAAQATAFLETDTAVSDGRGPGTETTPGAAEPDARCREKNAAVALREDHASLTRHPAREGTPAARPDAELPGAAGDRHQSFPESS